MEFRRVLLRSPARGVVMTQHEHPNVAVVREGFEAMQRGDTSWMDQHLADDVVWHVGGNSRWAGADQGKAQGIGRASCRERVCQDGDVGVVAERVKRKKKERTGRE